MPLSDPFTKGKNTMFITLLLRTGKKYRKIAKGELNFYKKYFLNDKLAIDKWIYLNLYETQLEQMGHSSNILKAVSNTGKIYMKAQLLDPLLEDGSNGIPKNKNILDNISIYTATTHASAMTQILKQNIKNLANTKDKAQANKTEKFRSITENSNDFLRSLKNRKNVIDEDLYEDIEEEVKPKKEEFDDGLSDVSISIIDGTEENHLEIDHMNLEIDSLVSKIKVIYENKINELLPTDPQEIKNFLKNFTQQMESISESYSQNLHSLSDINKKIRDQAKDYYLKYKDIKKNFKKERRELKNKNRLLQYEVKNNQEENSRVKSAVEDVKNEINFFKNKVGVKDSNLDKDEDLFLMIDVLNSLKHSDVDITAGLDENQKAAVNEIISKYHEEEEVQRGDYENEADNYINDEVIINKIEDIVNENFSNKKIINIKIDQITEDSFKFNDKNAVLFIENDELKVREKGFDNFEAWIIYNFGTHLQERQSAGSIKKPVQTNGKSLMQNVLDKKLAEKKSLLESSKNGSSKAKQSYVKKWRFILNNF